jgi:Spy/CpxP family protein refolding chaperone
MRLKILFIVVASLIAGTAGVVYVNANTDSTGVRGKMMWQKMTEKLGLTADQQAKLKDLRVDMRKQNEDTWAKIKTIRDKVKNELLASNPSQPALYGYEKEINDLQGAMAEKRIEHLLKVKELLTPDQFKTLLSMKPFQGKGHEWKHGSHGVME